MDRKILNATSLLIGTTIGAGFLGIPYVFAKAGFLVGTLHLFLVGGIMLFINLLLGEISLRDRKSTRLNSSH